MKRMRIIIVGGVAAACHGAARATYDVDIVYARTPDNHRRLARALAPHAPYLRGAPPGLPFRWDTETIDRGLNFTLTTTLGDLDLLGEIAGGGRYEQLLAGSVVVPRASGSRGGRPRSSSLARWRYHATPGLRGGLLARGLRRLSA